MFGYMYGIDITYILICVPALLFAMWAQYNVSTSYKKYGQIRGASGMTGQEAAQLVLSQQGIYNVQIERIKGNLTDHYDPRQNVIRLSEGVYDSPSVAAVGIAAHEAGHAVQHAKDYGPVKLRSAIIPVAQICSNLAMPMVLLGIIFSYPLLSNIGLIFFAIATFFQLVTLPVEFNASARANEAIASSGRFSDTEAAQSRKMLSAAALTYVAALAVSLANLLRLFLLTGRRRR